MSKGQGCDESVTTVLSEGTVWHLLHSEREDLCDTLLRNVESLGFGLGRLSAEMDTRIRDQQLQARLRLIDDALDRLMNGTYGECVKCQKWIEDSQIDTDP